MQRITADDLIKEFQLPRTVANEILATERQRAMRSHWQCWSLLLLPALVLGGLLAFGVFRGNGAPFMMFAFFCSLLSGNLAGRYAAPAARKAAKEKAERLAGTYSSRRPRLNWWA